MISLRKAERAGPLIGSPWCASQASLRLVKDPDALFHRIYLSHVHVVVASIHQDELAVRMATRDSRHGAGGSKVLVS